MVVNATLQCAMYLLRLLNFRLLCTTLAEWVTLEKFSNYVFNSPYLVGKRGVTENALSEMVSSIKTKDTTIL